MFIKRLINRFLGDPLQEPTSRPNPTSESSQVEDNDSPTSSPSNEIVEAATPKREEKGAPSQPSQSSPSKEAAAPATPPTAATSATAPEEGEIVDPLELCGVTKKMSDGEVQERLAWLYRRHNAAASSLDHALREEAELMLEAIVEVRHQYFGD